MNSFDPTSSSLIPRIERALVAVAYLLELDGDQHLPLFEKFERDLAEHRQRQDSRARARRLLNALPRALPEAPEAITRLADLDR